jgi:hypothetical protein
MDIRRAIIYRIHVVRYQKSRWNIDPYMLDFKAYQSLVPVEQAILVQAKRSTTICWEMTKCYTLQSCRLLSMASAILIDIECSPPGGLEAKSNSGASRRKHTLSRSAQSSSSSISTHERLSHFTAQSIGVSLMLSFWWISIPASIRNADVLPSRMQHALQSDFGAGFL